MSKLIYFICTGLDKDKTASQNHVDMCNMSIQSLINFGSYKDDIMVITDKPDSFPSANNIIELTKNYVTSLNDIGILKFSARQWINVKEYDSIIYLDNDILILNDIYPIFDYINDNILLAEEYGINDMYVNRFGYENIPFIKEEEKKDAKLRPRINTGIICFDSEIFLKYANKMETFIKFCIEEYEYKGVEQHPINIMIIREELNYAPIFHNWTEFPIGAMNVSNGAVIQEETKILHYVGNISVKKKLDYMREDVELVSHNKLTELQQKYSS